jgi:hypothetical protein
MGGGQESVPRGGDDPLMSRRAEAEGDVHRGQPGTDEEHRLLGTEFGERARRPGVFDPPATGATQRDRPARWGRARGEDHAVAGHDGATVQHHRHARAVPNHVGHPGPDMVDRPEHRAKVLAVPGPREERPGVRVGQPMGPLHEVVGLVGEGAHAARPDIQQVSDVGGSVGDAAPECSAWLDDDHPHRHRRLTEEVDRSQRTGCTTPDDADGFGAGTHGSDTIPSYPIGKACTRRSG